VKRALQALRRRVAERRHSTLLAAIVALFAIRPIFGTSAAASLLVSVALILVMLVALYTVQVDELVGDRDRLVAQRRRAVLAAWGLALLAVVERVVSAIEPSHRILALTSLVWLAFFAFVTWIEFRSVLRQRRITSETLSMAISVYLLLGLTFANLYVALTLLDPGAFAFGASLGTPPGAAPPQELVPPTLVYFSFVTLTTMGYGDITPLSLPAKYGAVAEGVLGQLYLAILVARLVGMQAGSSQGPEA